MRAWKDVAELVTTKTLNGGLVARCAPGLPFLLSEGMEVAFVPPRLEAPRSARVCSVSMQASDGAIVSFEGIDSVEVAGALVGCRCLVRRDCLPELDKADGFDSDALFGFQVIDEREGLLGTLQGIQTLPGQRLLEVKRAGAQGAKDASGVGCVSDAEGLSGAGGMQDAAALGGAKGAPAAAELCDAAGLHDMRSAHNLLIPLVEEFVLGVDEDARCIDVRIPAGLLDL